MPDSLLLFLRRCLHDRHSDFIGIPEKAANDESEAYYSTLLHEQTHWTGHPTRLNRPGIADAGSPKLEVEAVEELIAEIGSAFLCAEIRNHLRHEGYVLRSGNWKTIRRRYSRPLLLRGKRDAFSR